MQPVITSWQSGKGAKQGGEGQGGVEGTEGTGKAKSDVGIGMWACWLVGHFYSSQFSLNRC